MSDDRRDPAPMHMREPFVHEAGDAEVAELDEQVTAPVNRILFRRAHGRLHVDEGEMKVAPQAQARLWPDSPPQLLNERGEIIAIKEVTIVRMGCGNNVLNAVL